MRLPLNPFALLPRPEAMIGFIVAGLTLQAGGSPLMMAAGTAIGLYAGARERGRAEEVLRRARPQALEPEQVRGMARLSTELARLFRPGRRPRIAVMRDEQYPYRLGIGLRDRAGYRLVVGAALLHDAGTDRFTDAELRALISHEAAHAHHGDLDRLSELGHAAFWGSLTAIAYAALETAFGVGVMQPMAFWPLLPIGIMLRPLRAAAQRAAELRADSFSLRQQGVDAGVAEQALLRYLTGEACAQLANLSHYEPEQAARIGARFLALRRRELDAEGMRALRGAYVELTGALAYAEGEVEIPPRGRWQRLCDDVLASHPALALRRRAFGR